MRHPFTQIRTNGRLIREFSKDVNSSELVWHRDRYDREVKVVVGKGWQLQLENKLPQTLKPGLTYHIPARTYHRVIKGTTKLVVEIKENKLRITKGELKSLIKEALGNDPVQQILQWAEEGGRVTVAGKNIWPGLGNTSGLHSYGDELISKKWAKSGDRFAKKVESLPPGTEVELKRFKNINRDRGRWVTAGTVTTVASSSGSGEQPSRPVLKMIYELLGFLHQRRIGASNISNISVYTKDDAPFRGKVWQVTMQGETYLFPDDKSSQELAEDTYGDGIWEIISPF